MTLNLKNVDSFLKKGGYFKDFDLSRFKITNKELIADFEELTQKMSNSDYKYLFESNRNGRYDRCLEVIEHKIKTAQEQELQYYQKRKKK